MLESTFKNKVKREMGKDYVFIQNSAGDGVPSSFPDTTVIAPKGQVFFAEWKRSEKVYLAGKKTEHQQKQAYWINKLNKMGHNAQFIYPENAEEWQKNVKRLSA